MKLRISIFTLAVFFSLNLLAQDYKTAVIGTWKVVAINDSLAAKSYAKRIAEAKTDEDKFLQEESIDILMKSVKEGLGGSILTLDSKGELTMTVKAENGKNETVNAPYKLNDNLIIVHDQELGKDEHFGIITSIDNKRMIVRMEELFDVIVIYERQ